MEGSLASLTFKGSIAEAIFEAKKQRKLFVVYISGYYFSYDSYNFPAYIWCPYGKAGSSRILMSEVSYLLL